MAIAYQTIGSAATVGGSGNVAVVHPSTNNAGDILLVIVGLKPATANGGTCTPPSGWTLRHSVLAKGGYSTTLGTGTGNTNLYFYTKDTVDGTEDFGTFNFAVTDNSVAWGVLVRLTKGTTLYEVITGSGEDTSGGTTFSGSVDIAAVKTIDVAIIAGNIADDDAGTNFTTPSFSVGSASVTERLDGGTTGGFDIQWGVWTATFAADANGPGTFSVNSDQTTPSRGPIGMISFRELPSGSAALTETGADTLAGTGEVLVQGSAALVETGSDVMRVKAQDPETPAYVNNLTSRAMVDSNQGSTLKPLKVTTYTSGSGTFTPAYTNGLARITLVGGGGGGARGDYANQGNSGYTGDCGGGGGGGGAFFHGEFVLLDGSYSYSVGAGGSGDAAAGTGVTDGGDTTLGPWAAPGGSAGSRPTNYEEFVDPDWVAYAYDGYGGNGGGYWLVDDTRPALELFVVADGLCSGGAGGRGVWNTPGFMAGLSAGYVFGNGPRYRNPSFNNVGSSSDDAGGGGHTFIGQGATPKTAKGETGAAGVGYGGGGGGGAGKLGGGTEALSKPAGGAGAGGIIIIEEFGAAPITS